VFQNNDCPPNGPRKDAMRIGSARDGFRDLFYTWRVSFWSRDRSLTYSQPEVKSFICRRAEPAGSVLRYGFDLREAKSDRLLPRESGQCRGYALSLPGTRPSHRLQFAGSFRSLLWLRDKRLSYPQPEVKHYFRFRASFKHWYSTT
jgi:hypothetical protein